MEITDAKEFRRRVKRVAERYSFQPCFSQVEYFDSYPSDVAFGGKWSFKPAFLKRREYQLEREFRITLNTDTTGDAPVTLDIGDISDIAFYAETQKLGNLEWQITSNCPLCGNRPCECIDLRPEERLWDRRSEFYELHDFSCDKCGSFSVTGTAVALLEQRDTSGIVALGLPGRNIVVIADEAHRSQYDFTDGYARHMRDALPNASFIGTPIELEDANTRAVFGEYISIYDIQRSVEDRATVPI